MNFKNESSKYDELLLVQTSHILAIHGIHFIMVISCSSIFPECLTDKKTQHKSNNYDDTNFKIAYHLQQIQCSLSAL